MIGKTTIHLGKKYSRNHNLRTEKAVKDWNKDNHINYDKTKLNIVLCDMHPKEFFEQTFGDALMQFNANNYKKHPDRLIGMDYDTYVKNQDKPKFLMKKAVTSYYSEQKKNIQEAIIQMSDSTNFKQLCDKIGFDKAVQQHKEFLTQVFENWQQSNPNFKVFSAVMHFDEATPHLHIDFVPTAETDRGLTVKVSVDGALKNMGFNRVKGQKYAETPYKQWLAEQRTKIDTIASKYMTIKHAEPTSKGHIEYYQHKYDIEAQSRLKTLIDSFRSKSDVNKAKKIVEHIDDIEQMLSDEEANLKNKQADLDFEMERIRNLSQRANQIYEDNLQKQEQIDQKSKELDKIKSDFEAKTKNLDKLTMLKARAYADDILQKLNIDLSDNSINRDIEQANQDILDHIQKNTERW